jgi:uncharacterized sodium:solute symporter family permease YidK
MDNFANNAEPTDPDYVEYEGNCSILELNNTCISCSAVTKYYKNLLRPATDPELPWSGMVFGLTVTSVWYWCSDQVFIQIITFNIVFWKNL